MKSAKELFERLKTDGAFAKDFSEALKAKREAGAKSYYETFIPAAAERGYELSREELDEVLKAQDSELSAEELGKVAGGGSCVTLLAASIMMSVGVALTMELKL